MHKRKHHCKFRVQEHLSLAFCLRNTEIKQHLAHYIFSTLVVFTVFVFLFYNSSLFYFVFLLGIELKTKTKPVNL